MSDTMGYDEYDPASEELILQMLASGWSPYGQQMNVPWQKENLGSSTDPTRAWKSQDTILKSQNSLLGFSPIEEFAGPQPELWIPGTEQLSEEVAGDDIGQQLLDALNNGEGIINLQRQIAESTYDPEQEDPSEERPLSPQQAEIYQDWLKRYSKARSEDYIKLGQPGTVTDPAETDVMADVPTDEALNFDEESYIDTLRKGGAFGEDRIRKQELKRESENFRPDYNVKRMVRGVTNSTAATANRRMAEERSSRMEGSGPLTKAISAGNRQLEQKYRGDARKAQASSTRPSLAKERAFRAIVAYRMAHGMNPT